MSFGVFSEHHVVGDEHDTLGIGIGGHTAALCLSGGGIRSAAFSLGAISPLLDTNIPARPSATAGTSSQKTLLGEFHYLSTVSGGGYTGAWLTRWIADNGLLALERLRQPEAIRALRCYTNFLTPTPGLGSADIWAAAILWLRNTLINWMVFAPLLLGVACVPMLYLLVPGWIETASPAVAMFLLGTIGLLGLFQLGRAIHAAILNLPTHRHPDPRTPGPTGATDPNITIGPGQSELLRKVIRPTLVWAFLAPLAAAPLLPFSQRMEPVWQLFWMRDPSIDGSCWFCIRPITPDPFRHFLVQHARALHGLPQWPLWLLPLGMVLVGMIAFGLTWHRLYAAYDDPGSRNKDNWKRFRRLQSATFSRNVVAWFASCLCSGAVLGLGLVLARHAGPVWVAVAGPLWVVASDVIRSTFYVALRREGLRSGLDREWLARLNATKLQLILLYSLVGAATLLLPALILDDVPHHVWKPLVATLGFLAGPVAAWIGSSARAVFQPDAQSDRKWSWLVPEKALALASLLFLLALLMAFGRLAAMTAFELAAQMAGQRPAVVSVLLAGTLLLVACGILAPLIGRVVKVNRFSLHAVYANRLVRAFLGTARAPATRRPDPYTGFDPDDNVRVSDLFDPTTRYARPPRLFPVINATLNVTRVSDTARAERKAIPFTITPRHCGSGSLRRPGDDANLDPRGAYVPTVHYAGADGQESGPDDRRHGLSLGTAMTISGAAISPNMGYHSSSLTAFVMTLFNARLGAWLPNPGMRDPSAYWMHRSSPPQALGPMLRELFGVSDSSGRYVYLSDGGHFDNLGLYEMLRRRCRWIIVIDAGQDKKYAYSDLGRTLQHAMIDFGAEVSFVKPIVTSEDKLPQHGAYARITYRQAAGRNMIGSLLYIKPWLPAGAPIELQAFKALKEDFPNASTADQFFTESDFESYRALGAYLMQQILTVALPHGSGTIEQLFEALERLARKNDAAA